MQPPTDNDDPEDEVPSRDPSDLDPEEREFWDLDDEEGDEDPKAGDDAGAEPDEASGEASADDGDDGDDDSEASPEAAEDSQDGDEEEPGKEEAEGSSPPLGAGRKLSKSEVIWLGVLGVVLLTVVIYALNLFFREVPTRKALGSVDFPVKGARVVVAKVDTFWRKPDREKDKGVRLDVRFIPAATVKLKSGSGTSALRFFFENEEGDLVGDPTTAEISDGTFTATGSAEMEIHSTGGFEDEGQYNAYITEEVKFWHFVATEGPDPNASGQEFEEILRIRISPKRR